MKLLIIWKYDGTVIYESSRVLGLPNLETKRTHND